MINTFIKKSLLLILPFCILTGIMEYGLKSIPNGYNSKRKYLEEQADSIEVLVLGSSQTLYGVDPAYFSKKAFNLANVSQTIYYDTEIAYRYLDRMHKLKYVIIPVSYFSLWQQICDGQDEWRDFMYSHFWNIRYPEIKLTDSRLYSYTMLYTPRVSLLYAFKLFHVDLRDNLRRNGYSWKDTTGSLLRINDILGRERVEFYDRLHFPSRFNEICSTLERFVERCKKRGLKVIFITPPVCDTYYKFTNPEVNRINTETVNKMSTKYNCPYYDYFRDKRFSSRDFFDNDHLNFAGAEKFTRILDHDILN